MSNYTFGAFQLNAVAGGLGYYVIGRDLPLPVVKPVTYNIARRDGAKKSGEAVDPRQVTLTIKVVGSSRTDCIARVDALQQALALRGQALCIHEDGRYYQNVDALSAPVSFKAGGGVVSCEVQVAFLCYDPYAYASAQSSYDSGVVALTLSGGLWNFPPIAISGGGTTYSLPLIRLYNRTSSGASLLTAARNSGTVYTTLAVAATPYSGAVGDTIILSNGTNTQTVTVATGFSAGATTITVSSFTANANYTTSSSATKNTQWSSITVAQSNDSQTITGSNSATAPLPNLSGDYVDIQCDPTGASGWTIQTNGSGQLVEPLGVFPVIEPTSTSFAISIASGSAVSAEAVISWLPRYLS